MTDRRTDTIAGVFALLVIVGAWFIGTKKAIDDVIPHLEKACKEAPFIEKKKANIFEAFQSEDKNTPYAYLVINSANGFGGEMITVTVITPEGSISGTRVIDHKETFLSKTDKHQTIVRSHELFD